ncbi:MAG: hypothetical protein QNK15_04840 [Cycloclasticus sp.]|nr:hypothetical protein [Cycloclasticus sp.]
MYQLRAISGVLLFVGLVVTLVNAFIPLLPHWLGGASVWLAGLILFFDLAIKQKKIILTIASLAGISWFIAWQTDRLSNFIEVISINQSMIVMLIGVQFLQLVALPDSDESESLPVGERGFIKSYLGVHLFCSVINLSVVLLVADRWAKKGKLSRNQLKLLTRGFCSAAHWSPFFAAFAAAMVFTPNATLSLVIPLGLVMAFAAFLLTWIEVKKDDDGSLENFVGYPMRFEALWLIVVLVSVVFVLHLMLPSIKVLLLIALSALSVSLLVLLARKGAVAAALNFEQHLRTKLPNMKSELVLFLIAGVLGAGVASALDGLSIAVPITHFDGVAALIILFFTLILALVGVHPVISIAVIGHWLADIQPDQTLLAIMFLMSWAIGASASPVSGVSLALQGRYDVSGWSISSWNLGYAIKMYGVACVVLLFASYLLGL